MSKDRPSALGPDELGAFPRREGVHEADLQRWREAVVEWATSALEGGATRSSSRGVDTERELRRKDRALAETAALLVLQKNVHEIWRDADDGTGDGNAK